MRESINSKTLNDPMEDFNRKLEQVENDVKRILYYLENDDATGQEGLVSRVKKIETKQDSQLEREKIFAAKSTVWGMVGTAILAGFMWVVKLVISKWV